MTRSPLVVLLPLLALGLVHRPLQAQFVPAPAGERVLLTAEGRGVQIYRCDLQSNGPQWTFVGPEAKLFVGADEVGSHAAGPVWTYKDGSSVTGSLLASADSTVAGSVPWLLLKTKAVAGSGMFTRVTYIQRTNTSGGKADPNGCDATHAGTTARVPYTATYTFYAHQ